MDATTDQIKREIEEARERISENTSQLGERIRQTFDWRQQVGEHPWAAVGIVAGAGFVLGAASAKMLGRGARAASSYGEQYTYDRIGRDVEPQAPSGDGRSEWLRGTTVAAAEPPTEPWGPRETGPERFAERHEAGRQPRGLGRAGAAAGLLASLGAAVEPQLKEIGRNLAEQLKDLSNHLIGQGKEAMKQKVDQWRSGSKPSGGGAYGRGASEGRSEAWSESPGAWPSGSTTAAGAEDSRDVRTPQSRESDAGERQAGGKSGTGI